MKPYSRRNLAEPDHYTYDYMPTELRQKIIYCMEDTLPLSDKVWTHISETLQREYGERWVSGSSQDKIRAVLESGDAEIVVDVIECFLSKIRSPTNPYTSFFEDNLRHINEIFREYSVGYEFSKGVGNKVLGAKIDSKYLHKTATKKSMKLLYDLNFEGPLEEFDDAIEALDNKDTDKAITEALKAFESTMKAILQKLGYQYDQKWAAKDLIKACVDADVIPKNLDSFSSGIRTILESGLPTIRNMPGPTHGTGLDPKDIERSYAQFAVNLCGSYLVFLIERYEEKK